MTFAIREPLDHDVLSLGSAKGTALDGLVKPVEALDVVDEADEAAGAAGTGTEGLVGVFLHAL